MDCRTPDGLDTLKRNKWLGKVPADGRRCERENGMTSISTTVRVNSTIIRVNASTTSRMMTKLAPVFTTPWQPEMPCVAALIILRLLRKNPP